MVIIVQKLKLKRDAIKVEINDMRDASCLTVAPTVMDATLHIECTVMQIINYKLQHACNS